MPGIKIFCVNINRVSNKFDAITDLLDKNCFEIIILVHTQLKNSQDFPQHRHYKYFHQICVSEKAGGISIIAKRDLKINSINLLNEIDQYGNVWVHIKTNIFNVAVGAVYFKVVDGCRPDERLDNI